MGIFTIRLFAYNGKGNLDFIMTLLGIIVTFQDENVLRLYQGQSLYTGLKQTDPGPSHDLD